MVSEFLQNTWTRAGIQSSLPEVEEQETVMNKSYPSLPLPSLLPPLPCPPPLLSSPILPLPSLSLPSLLSPPFPFLTLSIFFPFPSLPFSFPFLTTSFLPFGFLWLGLTLRTGLVSSLQQFSCLSVLSSGIMRRATVPAFSTFFLKISSSPPPPVVSVGYLSIMQKSSLAWVPLCTCSPVLCSSHLSLGHLSIVTTPSATAPVT